jgi:hypothetical protein
VELIDDKAYCYDCLKEIVKDVRGETRKSLTMRILAASLLALLVAIVSLHDAYALLEYLPTYIYRMSVGSHDTFDSSLLAWTPSLIIGLAFLALGFGLATTKKWSYWYGIALSAVILIFDLIGAINLGGISYFMDNPMSNVSLFHEAMMIGPLLLLVAVFGSRRELTGW